MIYLYTFLIWVFGYSLFDYMLRKKILYKTNIVIGCLLVTINFICDYIGFSNITTCISLVIISVILYPFVRSTLDWKEDEEINDSN